ncbi:MAG: GNAT family N-acetyltransferase [Turicibacter sp.]|nr:GNAT family N-acetyltransferase [Turicibacter sp.]
MVFDNWSSDDEVTKFVTWPTHEDLSTTEAILISWEKAYELLTTYQWAMVDREIDEVIGSISLFQFHRRGSQHYCELGYCLSRKYWNRGVTTEAAKAILQFAFEEIGIDVVMAKHDVRNIASGKVMKKLGMIHDKLVIRAVLNGRNEWVDCDTYVISKADFKFS